MKRALIALCLLMQACAAVTPLASPEDSFSMRVVCKGDAQSRSQVLSMLRQVKARDVKDDGQAGMTTITAAFYKSDLVPGQLEALKDDLMSSGLVAEADITENHSVVRDHH